MKPDQSLDPNNSLTEKLVRIVLDNLQNEQFGVSELAQMTGMSRSHLHRKLSLLKNQSISQFIREIRLREAYKLLKSGTLNASEVAYKVGFNNPSYFNKCFNDFYGFPPGKAKSHIVSSSHSSFKSNIKSVREDDNVLSIAFKAKPKKAFVQRRTFWLLTSVIIVTAFLLTFKLWWVPGHLEPEPVEAVLILPFDNYIGDSRLDYFVSGMHSSLITEIGKLSGLRVISETTSKAFQNAGISLKEIAEELSIEAVVETAVTCLGDSICVQFKVITIFPEEKQVWIGDVKEEKSKILSIYSNVTKQIATEINVAVTPFERELLSEPLPVDTEAYDAYMKGLYKLDKVNKSSIDSAIEFFNTALEKNPNWSLPYSGLTQAWAYHMQMGFVLPSQAIPKIYINLNRALELDPYSANSHYVKGIIAVWTEWNWEKGEAAFKKAIELNPNHASTRIGYAHLLLFLHREEEALEQANIGVELDPFSPFLLAMHAKVLIYTNNYTAAKTYITKALKIDPDHRFAKGVLRQYYYVSGDFENWFRVWKENSNSFAKYDSLSIEKTFYEKGHLAVIRKVIDKTEAYESTGRQISYTGLAIANLRIKNYEKALEYMHKAYAVHDPNLTYASTIRYDSDILKDYPQYIELMKKMRLPVN